MSTFQDKIEIYADIALKVGVNLQKDQTLYISTPLYAAEFVRILAKKAYQAGAKHVHVEWSDEELTRLKFELASEASLSEFPNWKVQALVEEAENNAAFLRISESGGDPDLLKDIDREETLRRLLESDEGASYIGEIALVPYRSHISDMNLIFFNTLLDENASTHLALGSAYPINIEGGNEMEKKELEEKGINTSITHVDFMIGTADMSIDGIHKDGTREPLFRNGGWAF